ncbi:S-layer homology domain-containing protein [Bhargavaea ullalensis]|uniref:SLH domain-containing protein n=1 Tax=Bhargavaea ullalensis TaxID=1265685 RepID=A0ABV2GEG4_9BACL|nr:S-layer homology domain-containing protein [Bhargavaea cecembensis]
MKSLTKWVLAGVLAAGTLLPSAVSAAGYTDINENDAHYSNIMAAQDYGLLTGYADGTFKSSKDVQTATVIKALGKLELNLTGETLETYDYRGIPAFKDIPKSHPDQELYKFSLIVRDAGIFNGDPNGNVFPSRLIKRDAMAKVIVNAFALEDLEDVPTPKINDLNKAAKDMQEKILILKENGVTTETLFRPQETVKRGQLASFLVRAFEAMINYPIAEIEQPDPVETMKGVAPELPETVFLLLTNGVSIEVYVDWDLSGVDLNHPGVYTAVGTIDGVEDEVIEVQVTVDDVRDTDPVVPK